MRTYIRKLQAKPEHVRKQILYGTIAISMVFVGFIWISGLGSRFSKQNPEKISEDIKPFALFGQSISDTYKNISASVGGASENLKNEIQAADPSLETGDKVEGEKQIDLIPVEYQ
jgi:hypothetical protein